MASVSIGSLSLRKGGITSAGGTNGGAAPDVTARRVKIAVAKNDRMAFVMAYGKIHIFLRPQTREHCVPACLSARLGDWIEIRGRLGEVGAARFWCDFEMRREEDGALLVTARQALALVKMPEGKPLRLPRGFGGRGVAD